jgi:hypothetical protein
VRFYGLISADTEEVVDFFPSEEAALTALLECLADEPEWENVLRVEPCEFETSLN